MYIDCFTLIILFHDYIGYTKSVGNKNYPNDLTTMVNYHYQSENRLVTRKLSSMVIGNILLIHRMYDT